VFVVDSNMSNDRFYNDNCICKFRSDGMENRIPEKRNKYMDSVIVLDDASNDPLKKRLDASSSLLSSFADSDFTALQYVLFVLLLPMLWTC